MSRTSIEGAIFQVKGTYYGTNISRVTYRFKDQAGQIVERATLVVGINTFNCFEADLKAAFAIAKSMDGRPVKIMKVEFVETGIVTGVEEEALDLRIEYMRRDSGMEVTK